ncbi:hypothetical protein DFJ74DRAFT_650597 [Hyaloraphidium curvatum]|nr:hypothetical protein DFJ74DRAFT_650597 [Hyaloraphidium curvatum]
MPPPQRPADPPASPASAGSDNPAWWGVVMGPDAVRGSPGSDLALKSPKSNLTLASSSALALPPARSASAGSDHLDFASFSTGSFAAVGGMPATVPPQPTGPFQVTVPLQASAQTSTLAGIPTMVGSGASSAASMAKLLSLSQLSTSPVSPLAPSLPSHLTLMDDLPPLPDAGILRYLVEAYFSTIGASLPIFHRPTFSAALAQQPLFLVWIMAAIAIPFLPHHLSSSPLSRRLLAAMPAEAHSALRPPARRALQTNLVERSRRVLLRIAEATPVGGGAEVGPAFRLAKMAGLVLLGMASAFRFYKGAVEFTDAVTVS